MMGDDERGAVSQSTGHFFQFASDSSDSGSSESRLAFNASFHYYNLWLV
jgi:hypothetical protein